MRAPFRITAGLVLILGLLGALFVRALHSQPPPRDPRVLPDDAVDPSITTSNILPEDYVGPESCKQCHAGKYRSWSAHPHSKMNQNPHAGSVQGHFDGSELVLTNGTITFTTEDGSYHMTVRRGGAVLRQFRVTRTVGTRYIQFYIGVQVIGPEPAGHDVYSEHLLPFAWWASLGRWLPKHYCDISGDEELVDGIPQEQGVDKWTDVRRWNSNCIPCHNTVPYAYRAFSPLWVGFPDATVSLTLGPLSSSLKAHIDIQGNPQSFDTITQRLDPERHLVALGVSCESCHFGGRDHATNANRIAFLPTSPYLKITDRRPDRPLRDNRKAPATVTGLCTQCHSANVPLYDNGQAQCNAREGHDFNGGACSSQMTCVQCHEPHTAGPPEGGPTDPAHLAACVGCHEKYATPTASAAHSRHAAQSGVDCLDCHMPRQSLGLDALVRTHRIAVPVAEGLVAKGQTNACNLCHLDKSVNWTLAELRRGWGRNLTPQPGWTADLDRPAGQAWLQGSDTATRWIAGQASARSPLGKTVLPDLIRALNDPEPVNRVFHARAVGTIRGQPLRPEEYDVTAPPAVRARQIERLLAEGSSPR